VIYTGSGIDGAGRRARNARRGLRAIRTQAEAISRQGGSQRGRAGGEYLGHEDGSSAYAARIRDRMAARLTTGPTGAGRDHPQAALTAVLALARYDNQSQAYILKSLEKFSDAQLSESQQLDKLRVIR